MLKKYSDLLHIFGEENAAKVFVLKIGALFYPILRAEGFGLRAPVGIVVEDEEMIDLIVEELRGFSKPTMISLSERRKDFIDKVNGSEYELVTVLYKISSTHNRENAFYLNEIMTSGYADKRVFNKLPIVFFIGGIPSEVTDFLTGKIMFDGRINGGSSEFQLEQVSELLVLFGDYWTSIQEKMNDILADKNRRNVFLEACREIALIYIKAEAKATDDQRVIRMFGMHVDAIKNSWDVKNDYFDWIDKLRELMREEGQKLTAAENRNKIIEWDYKLSENRLLFDEKYYYITEHMFAFACSSLSYYVGQCEMKNALAEAGILVGEGVNRKYFSVKVPISTPNGIRVIGRRMRIRREWMDRPGELTWAEQIKLRRGKEE